MHSMPASRCRTGRFTVILALTKPTQSPVTVIKETLLDRLTNNEPIILSPGSKLVLDLGQRKRKRSKNDERPDILSNDTIYQAYILYKEKQPKIPDPEPIKDDSLSEQVRNTRPRNEHHPVAPERSVPALPGQQGDEVMEDAQAGLEPPLLNPHCSASMADSLQC